MVLVVVAGTGEPFFIAAVCPDASIAISAVVPTDGVPGALAEVEVLLIPMRPSLQGPLCYAGGVSESVLPSWILKTILV
jgi:hypothetical protein